MLYLNSGVHFDKVMVALRIHQEFQGTCTLIIYRTRNLQSVRADGFPLRVRQTESRSEFDHFLVSSLYGAVSLIEMYQIAVFIA